MDASNVRALHHLKPKEEKIFFQPGEIVTLNKNIPNVPIMYVIKKESKVFKMDTTEDSLIGIRCRWFTTCGQLQEAVFNTKDLIKV